MSLDSKQKRIVVFASGSGSNAVKLCRTTLNHPDIKVVALFCNNPNAGVIEKMKEFDVPVVLFNRTDFRNEAEFLEKLNQYQPDLIALLGFLWKIPAYLVDAFPTKIVNLHPALLPKFGGKGMYGHFVHEAVKAANEKETGISIHYVNENFDEGEIIAQFKVDLNPNDTAESIADKIHVLEQTFVAETIIGLLK
ncbi:MAG: phosphoribosylglycinamide formyltransferase [Bacteroidia bacterium]